MCLPALKALRAAAEECGGQIVVNPIRYKNPTSREENRRAADTWAPEVRDYLIENEIRPHELLAFMTAKAQATAANPLPARVSSRTKDRSAVFGHPQLSMRTVATPHHKLPKILYSSGAITEKAYSDTQAGDMADFHHSIAAIKVEVRGDRFHLREITWDGKRFIDIDRAYTPRGIVAAPRAEALVMGDLHDEMCDPLVLAATLEGPDSICATTRPRRVYLHDTYDGKPVNPHERGRALTETVRAGLRVEASLRPAAELINRIVDQSGADEVDIVWSNHDDFLHRWLEAFAPAPGDRVFFTWLFNRMAEEHKRTGSFPVALEVALTERFNLDPRVRFLKPDESSRVKGVELGMHGHLGPDGARGSPQSLARIGTRFMSGHRHSPCIWQGGYWVGLSAVYDHGYNRGPSSWLQTHGLVHANGYRQLLHIIKGHYRG